MRFYQQLLPGLLQQRLYESIALAVSTIAYVTAATKQGVATLPPIIEIAIQVAIALS